MQLLKNENLTRTALLFFFKVSGYIAVPIILAVIIGKALDKKWGSDPLAFLIAIGIAFIISITTIVRETLTYIKKIQKDANDKKEVGDNKQGV